jgi:hypothetical protein
MNLNDSVRAEQSKKPYRSPTLVEYGAVRALTQALGGNGMGDGAGGGAPRNMTAL